MRFRRQVHHVGNGVAFHDFQHGRFVAKIDLFERVLGMFGYSLQIGLVTGVGQAIQINEPIDLGLINDMLNKVRANESSSPGDQ